MNGQGGSHPLELISAYLDDAVSESERRFVEAHLEACPTCRDLLEDLRVIAGAVPQVETPALPEGLAARIGARVDEASPRPRPRIRFAVPLAAAATLAAVALVTTVQWHQRAPRRAPAPLAERFETPPPLPQGKEIPPPFAREKDRALPDAREKGEPQAETKQNVVARREAAPAERKTPANEPAFAPAPAAPPPQSSRLDRSVDEMQRVAGSRAQKAEPALDKKKSESPAEVEGGVTGGVVGGVLGGVVGGVAGGAEGAAEAGVPGAAPESSPRGVPILSARAVSPRAMPPCRSTWQVPATTRWEAAEPWRAQYDLSEFVLGIEGSYVGNPNEDGSGVEAAVEVPRASFVTLLEGLRKRGASVAVAAHDAPADADCISMKITITPVAAPR